MDISEDQGSEDMMVQEMTTSTLILDIVNNLANNADMFSQQSGQGMSRLKNRKPEPARGGGGGGAGGGAGAGSGELGRRLLLAARHGDTPLVLDLMAKGAPFTTDWLGTSALHVAARGAHADTCAVLLRAGVSRDCRTKVERTPLHLAAAAGHAGVVSLLVQHRAAVDCRDMLRMTPLHWAAERGHARVAELLLAAGADPLARSKFHKTPRDLAARRRHADLLRLLDDAARMREAAASCRELQAATAAEADSLRSELDADGSQESKHRIRETKPTPLAEPIKMNIEKPLESSSTASLAAAAMLRRHGIALLPRDEGCTVLSALQSGRSVVLSDAGKLLLKESSEVPHVMKTASAPAAAQGGNKGVLLTATPVRSPPRQGVKIFTLNNKLLAMPKENKAPIKKVINPHDSKQIQFIKLPSDAKITPSRSVPMKAKNKLLSPRPAPAPAPLSRPTVKLVMQRPAQNKLTTSDNVMETSVPMEDHNVLFVPEEFLTNSSAKYLRSQLLTAHATIAALTAELNSYKTRLAKYENI